MYEKVEKTGFQVHMDNKLARVSVDKFSMLGLCS